MMRRLATSGRLAAPFPKRAYFYPQGGEQGISAATALRINQMIWVACGIASFWMYQVVFNDLSSKHQFLDSRTDLFEDDGTVMEGEEAVANLKIQHDRVSPFLNDIKKQLEEKGVQV